MPIGLVVLMIWIVGIEFSTLNVGLRRFAPQPRPTKASDWTYSSIHGDIGKGILSADWACGVDDLDCGY